MKRIFLLSLMIVLAMAMMAGVALADDPGATEGKPHTFIEEDPENLDIDTVDAIGRGRAETGYGGFGSSYWTYEDSNDVVNPGGSDSYKTEGSYRGFDATSSTDVDTLGIYTASPHGDYSTTSNKCKTCHAVHRAEGAFKLMRSDTADDACNYCHVGDHRHTRLQAYSGSDSGTVRPSNGHTIGAGKEIPDSSVKQWLEEKTLTGGDPAENGGSGYSDTINVRRYDEARNKMMVWTFNRSTHHQGEERWGPTLLTCISCHQPHNATELVWKPSDAPDGYKLLRGSPSGSIKNDAKMASYSESMGKSMFLLDGLSAGDTTALVHGNYGANVSTILYHEVLVGKTWTQYGNAQPGGAPQTRKVTDVVDLGGRDFILTFDSAITSTTAGMHFYGEHDAPTKNDIAGIHIDQRVKVSDVALSAAETGVDSTWTANVITSGALDGLSPVGRYRSVFTEWKGSTLASASYYLAPWCADCHNLNIGHYEQLDTNFRGGGDEQAHSDRTHTSGGRYTQCYACHRSDLPSPGVNEFAYEEDFGVVLSQNEGTTVTVGGTSCIKCHMRSTYDDVRDISDWPHAGKATSTKLLKDRLGVYDASGTPLQVDTTAAYDASTEHIDAICIDCHNLMGDMK